MNKYNDSRVVWHEGLLIRPHHFQQQERYFSHVLDRQLRSSRLYDWGFDFLKLDLNDLDQRVIGIKEAKGRFADGTPFEFPGPDLLPQKLTISDKLTFPEDTPYKGVYIVLAIP